MKPSSEANDVRRIFRPRRRFPITDYSYQTFSLDRSHGGPIGNSRPSFLNISREYFGYEARRNFLAESAFFLANHSFLESSRRLRLTRLENMDMTKAVRFAPASIAFCLLLSCRPAVDRTLEEMIDHSYPVEPTATLSVTNRDGSIRVYAAGAETRDVRVEAIKKAYRADRLKAISVQISAGPNSISIETIYPSDSGAGFADRSGTVDYVIIIPQTIRISKLELANGEVQLDGMRSNEARAQLGNGRLFAHNCFGNLDLNLKTGNLAIVYEWWEDIEFSIHATIQDGNAFAYIPAEAAFHLIAHTATGKIANDFAEKEQRHAEPTNTVDMLVAGGGKTTFEFEAQDGNVKITGHNP